MRRRRTRNADPTGRRLFVGLVGLGLLGLAGFVAVLMHQEALTLPYFAVPAALFSGGAYLLYVAADRRNPKRVKQAAERLGSGAGDGVVSALLDRIF